MSSHSNPGEGPPLGRAGRSTPDPGDGVAGACSPRAAAAGKSASDPTTGVPGAGPAGAAGCCSASQRWVALLVNLPDSRPVHGLLPDISAAIARSHHCGADARCRDLRGGGSRRRCRHICVRMDDVRRAGHGRACGRRRGGRICGWRLALGLEARQLIVNYDEAVRLGRAVPHWHILPVGPTPGALAHRVAAVPMAGSDGQVLWSGPADVEPAALLARPRPAVVLGRAVLFAVVALVPVPLVMPVPGVAPLTGPAAASAPRSRHEGVATQALPLALVPPCLGEWGGRGAPCTCLCPCRPGQAARR